MSSTELGYVICAFFIAASLKGVTGLGFSTICLGLLASVIDPRVSIVLVIIPSVTSNLMVMWGAGNFGAAVRRFWPMYLMTIPGLGVGLTLLGRAEPSTIQACLGLVMLGYAVWALVAERRRWGWIRARERSLSPICGLLTGTVNGISGSQVMPVLPYLMQLDLDKNAFVQAINISFTLSSFIMLIGLSELALVSGPLLWTGTLGIVPVGIGIWLGTRVRRRLPESGFRRVVLMVLALLGIALLVGASPASDSGDSADSPKPTGARYGATSLTPVH